MRFTKVHPLTGRAVVARVGEVPTGVPGLQILFRSSSVLPNVRFPVTAGNDGIFSPATLAHGVFRVDSIDGIPAGLCLSELRQGTRDVVVEGLEIRRDGNDELIATLRESEASVLGNVDNGAGKPSVGSIVALVPQDRSRTNLFAEARTDQNGSFNLPCVTPGSYEIFAWSEMEGAAYRNAEFMKAYTDGGLRIEVKAGRNVADLKILP
jgi:hypothetical protein